MTFSADCQENYTTTITQACGPTTTSARSINATTSEYVYLAKNGNDANTGLSPAQAKLTLAGAQAVVNGTTLTTIHIIRNGYTGDLVFDPTGMGAFLAGTIIQSEIGEIAKIFGVLPDLAASMKLYNLIIESQASATDIYTLRIQAGSDLVEITNCFVNLLIGIHPVHAIYGWETQFAIITGAPTTTISYSIIRGGQYVINNDANHLVVVTSVIAGYGLVLINYPQEKPTQAIAFSQSDPTSTIDCQRTIFINLRTVLVTAGGFNPGDLNMNLTKATLINTPSILFDPGTFPPPDLYLTISLNECHLGGATIIDGTPLEAGASHATLTYTSTNQYADQTPLLYRNLKAAINDFDFNGYRLQKKGGIAANGQAYKIDSPLLPTNTGEVWNESTSYIDSTFNKEVEILWPAKSVNFTISPKNPIEQYDVKGNLHSDHDSIRREIKFTFDSYQSNDTAWKLEELLHDKGSLKFWPRGKGVNNYDNALNGAFSSVDDSFSPIASVPLRPKHWRGFWMTINSKDYYISDNTNTVFYLVDKLELGFPADGSHPFTIEYMLVKPKLDSLTVNQENFTQFLKGGTWSELDGTAAFEYNGGAAQFCEVEDIESNA